jgi:HrpA-like RNA helicase
LQNEPQLSRCCRRCAPPLAASRWRWPLGEGLARHRDAVLQAPTGAGKSTIVPLALLQEPFSPAARS